MEKMNYDQAFEELEKILHDMRDNKIIIDELDISVSRARFLLDFCQSRLRSIEENINKNE